MKVLLAILVIATSSTVNAKGYSPAVTAQPGGYAIKYASDGTPLAVPASVLANGKIGATSAVSVALPGGINYPALATAAIAAGAMLTPWGSAIGVAIAAGSIGVAVLDQALEAAKIRVRPGGGGVQIADSSVCTVAPCYEYRVNDASVPLVWSNTKVNACQTFATQWQAVHGETMVFLYMQDNDANCRYRRGSGGDMLMGLVPRTVAPSPAAYVDATVDQAAQLMASRSPSLAEVQALIEMSYGPLLDLPTITGPASVYKGNTVQLGLDGTVTEIEERYIASFQPGIIGIGVEKKQTVTTPAKQSTSITTNPDGSTSSTVISTPRTTATLTTSTPTDQSPVTCGMPGTPPCVISEAGMPGKPEVDAAMKIKPSDSQKDIDDLIKNPSSVFPTLPTLNWSFALPAGCAQIPTPAFEPAMTQIDICQFQPMFHDLMTIVWVLGGLFGAISLFMKNAMSPV